MDNIEEKNPDETSSTSTNSSFEDLAKP